MKIQKSIKKAIDEMQNNDFEAAMLHVCNAIDGTAQRISGKKSTKTDFKNFICKYYNLIGAMTGTYSLDYKNIAWPVSVRDPRGPGKTTSFADMIYHIHRCAHNHGVEVPEGFEFIPDIASSGEGTSFSVQKGAIGLSDRFIWALIAIVVFEPANNGLATPELDEYYLTLGNVKYIINDWWGRADDLPPLPPKASNGILDFSQLK